jgi:hypothetical protein
MNPYAQAIAGQTEWARNHGLQLLGSRGYGGRKAYTTSFDDNSSQPLDDQTRADLEDGAGGNWQERRADLPGCNLFNAYPCL